MLQLLNEMANSVDFYNHKQKQQVKHVEHGKEYSIDFYRDGIALMYGFNGFGNLLGHYVYLKTEKYILAEGRIGIFDEVSLYIKNPYEKNFRIHIREDQEPRDNY